MVVVDCMNPVLVKTIFGSTLFENGSRSFESYKSPKWTLSLFLTLFSLELLEIQTGFTVFAGSVELANGILVVLVLYLELPFAFKFRVAQQVANEHGYAQKYYFIDTNVPNARVVNRRIIDLVIFSLLIYLLYHSFLR